MYNLYVRREEDVVSFEYLIISKVGLLVIRSSRFEQLMVLIPDTEPINAHSIGLNVVRNKVI